MNERGINTELLESKMFLNGYRTRKSFAESLGISEGTMGNILNGKHSPSHKLMNDIYSLLNLTPEEGTAIFFGNNLRNTKGVK